MADLLIGDGAAAGDGLTVRFAVPLSVTTPAAAEAGLTVSDVVAGFVTSGVAAVDGVVLVAAVADFDAALEAAGDGVTLRSAVVDLLAVPAAAVDKEAVVPTVAVSTMGFGTTTGIGLTVSEAVADFDMSDGAAATDELTVVSPVA